ncbi:MAG: glycosyltransferase family 1 protein [Chthoniobacterales bacterium]|nr:glycosyltransferase family 1 protein [Chthoniobacterales bacterium]
MNILYLGETNPRSTSAHRANALRRLGHEVSAWNPGALVPGQKQIPFFASFNVRTGFRLVASLVAARLRARLQGASWDLAWVDCGAELPPSFYRWLKERGAPIINYITDNPFQNRDYRKWDQYRKSLSQHDLTVVPRLENVEQARQAGAKDVLRVSFSYDPIAHAPTPGGVPTKTQDVLFVGSWMRERGPFATEVLRRGLSLGIIGDGWPRSPEWPALKSHWLGGSVYGRSYVEAIESTRIAIGLLSKGNRDLHTTRSVEVPFIGSAVFCAERTSEHMEMYREGHEAAFWDSPEECANVCASLLKDSSACAQMAVRARQRVIALKLSNDEVMASILDHLEKSR